MAKRPPKRTDGLTSEIIAAAPRTPEQARNALREKVHMFYTMQMLRMQCGGRMAKKVELGEICLAPIDQQILGNRMQDFAKLEKIALDDVKEQLSFTPFYVDILSDKEHYKGIGPTMAGVILSEFDIYREDTVSKMWAFAGLAPVPCHRCKKCHAVVDAVGSSFRNETGADRDRSPGEKPTKDDRKYIPFAELRAAIQRTEDNATEWIHGTSPKNVKCAHTAGTKLGPNDVKASGKQLKPMRGLALNYNAFLRCKLCGVLGSVLLRSESPWRTVYDNYKFRLENTKDGWGMSPGHRHNAAIRYMIKMLLLDIHKAWRTYLKLPLRMTYEEEKLAHQHIDRPLVHLPGVLQDNKDVEPLNPEVKAELDQL